MKTGFGRVFESVIFSMVAVLVLPLIILSWVIIIISSAVETVIDSLHDV